MIDIYKILDSDWFEQIGEFSNNDEEFAPIDYEEVGYALYSPNSFFGGEYVNLYVDEDIQVYYIKVGLREPIGDYGWHTMWSWYKSIDGKYEIIEKALKESEKTTHENNVL